MDKWIEKDILAAKATIDKAFGLYESEIGHEAALDWRIVRDDIHFDDVNPPEEGDFSPRKCHNAVMKIGMHSEKFWDRLSTKMEKWQKVYNAMLVWVNRAEGR